MKNEENRVFEKHDEHFSSKLPPVKIFTCYEKFQKILFDILESIPMIIFSTFLTIFSLFADDMRQLTADPDTDKYFFAIEIFLFCFFMIEIMLNSFGKKDYFLGFYFWLDLLSTFSVLLDIGWITSLMFGTSVGGSAAGTAQQASALIRAARASKIGSRAGRIVRILRLIRLIKLVRVYKTAEQKNIEKKKNEEKKNAEISDNNPLERLKTKTKNNPNLAQNDASKMKRTSFKIVENMLKQQIQSQKVIGIQNARTGNVSITQKNENIAESVSNLISKQILSGDIPQNISQIVHFEDQNEKDSEKFKEPVRENNKKFSIRDLIGGFNNGSIEIKMNKNLAEAKKGDSKTSYYENEYEISVANSKENPLENEEEKEELDMIGKETNVGQRLSDLTTKRVVLIVMLLMIAIPIFSCQTYIQTYSNETFGLLNMYQRITADQKITPTFESMWNYYLATADKSYENLLYMELGYIQSDNESTIFKNWGNRTDAFRFRSDELHYYAFPNTIESGNFYFTTIFENRKLNNIDSYFNIARTIFVCIILAGASLIMTNDVTNMIVSPLEKMLKTINNIKENPLNAMKIEEEEAFFWGRLYEEDEEAAREKQEQENYETSILEKVIVKIGGLLAIGFGEAGSEIIVQNMKLGGDINPIMPGNKIIGIYGFCDIRCFTDTTELLQEEVMIFVNEMAEIVHSIVDKYAGSANKNIGDAFLLVWKFENDCCEYDSNEQIQLKDIEKTHYFADMAVIAFVKILLEINQSPVVEKYNKNKKLTENLPNYRVRMGFGLSLGWAVEGAIGSRYKIDASYLSPNVNMCAKLEGATKGYGVPLLISSTLVNYCTPEVKKYLRIVDRVLVPKTDEPVELYSFDAEWTSLPLMEKGSEPELIGLEKKRARYILKKKKKSFHFRVLNGKIKTFELLHKSKQVRTVRKNFSRSFFSIWNLGFEGYLKGQWNIAIENFKKTLNFIPGFEDGPSKALLHFMEEEYNNKAPENWPGYRPFSDH